MPNALTYWAIRTRHLLSHVLNTGSGGIDIFKVNLTFDMVTVRGQQHSFSTHERLFLWKCQSLWDRKCLDLRGTRIPTFGFMPNALTYWTIRARHLLSHVLNTGSGGIDDFEVKLTFDMLIVRGQQHSFSTHERVFLWKCQSFWDRKCLYLRGTRAPNLRIHAKCSNILSFQGQTFAVPCFEHWLWWYRYFWSKVNIWYVNCARQQHSFSTHERVFLWKCQGFWDRKCLDLKGSWTSNHPIHAECSNLLSYQGQT